MIASRIWIGLVLLAWSVACTAAVSPSRRAYIRAHDFGWVEVRVVHDSVAADQAPLTASGGQPPLCDLEVTLDREPFLEEILYPFGQASPYRIDTGFRFEAPVGHFELLLRYSGCGSSVNDPGRLELAEEVWIDSGMVTPVYFDGSVLVSKPSVEDEAVTLERIYEELVARAAEPAE